MVEGVGRVDKTTVASRQPSTLAFLFGGGWDRFKRTWV